jgi:MFS family permease
MRRHKAADPSLPQIPWKVLGTVLLGTFLGPFGGMVVGFSLPSIARDFSVDLQTVKWVTLVFWLVTTFLVPVTGILGRRFGEARMFITGFCVDFVGTLLSGLATTFPLLIACRVLQALGSATMFALFAALITRVVPPQRRGEAFGLAGATVALSVTLAPVLGGLVLGLEHVGWRGVFLMQLPIHICGIYFGLKLLPRDPLGRSEPFPWASAFSWLLFTAGLVFTAEAFSHGLWIEHIALIVLATAVGLATFLYCELRLAPLFNYALFRIAQIRLGAISALLMNIILFAMLLLLPFYFEDYKHYTPRQMGMFLSLGPLMTLLLARYSGQLADRQGYRLPILAGLLAAALGFACLALGVDGQLPVVAAGIALVGVSGGLFNTPMTSGMMGSAGDALRAQASSLGSLMRNLGFMGGTALGSLWLSMFIGLHPRGGPLMQAAARTHELTRAVPYGVFVQSISQVFWVCTGIAALGLLINLSYPNRISPSTPK